jgi:hypothetical protein
VASRQAVISEVTGFANAVLGPNQSYSFSGQSNCQSRTAGAAGVDVNALIPAKSFGATVILRID